MKRGVIKAVRRGFTIGPGTPEWAYTLNSLRNHLKKKIISPVQQVTLVRGSRAGLVIEHNLGYTPFIDVYAKGSGDADWLVVPSILTGSGAGIENTMGIFSGTTQGDMETVVNFYYIDFYDGEVAPQVIDVYYVLNYDPSQDAWDS